MSLWLHRIDLQSEETLVQCEWPFVVYLPCKSKKERGKASGEKANTEREKENTKQGGVER